MKKLLYGLVVVSIVCLVFSEELSARGGRGGGRGGGGFSRGGGGYSRSAYSRSPSMSRSYSRPSSRPSTGSRPCCDRGATIMSWRGTSCLDRPRPRWPSPASRC